MAYTYALIVLGSGPGAYVAAIRASRSGLKAAPAIVLGLGTAW